MATDFWASSHYKRWIVDRATLRQARSDDIQYVDNPEHLAFLNIFFANLIAKLGKKLTLRQRVIATATVFFRRFYLRNSYCETDPFIVAAACCYVAAKAEESPVHIKTVVSDARAVFGEEYGIKTFPSDNSKLAEMEFYLVDELDCDLIVFHPYRTLMTLCGKRACPASEAEAGEADDAAGDGRMPLGDVAVQTAWFIINDTYRSELCLLYPPHLIAITAIYLTLVFNPATRATIQAASAAPSSASSTSGSSSQHDASRRSSRSASSSSKRQHASAPAQPPDLIGWMAGLNVSMPLVATLAQEIIALYALWDRYDEDAAQRHAHLLRGARGSGAGAKGRSASVLSGSAGTGSGAHTPDGNGGGSAGVRDESEVVTPMFLVQLLVRMREARMADLAHPPNGRPVAVNKRLERTQAAG
ncbi:cyclin-like protein [Trametes versicolor FP-101664 SS1]|uniref:cyclin-like protein n=1 Tax=Trametes versicolor (strain FP-101664) TaxID=717944 RepID=UPI0004624421|nr:cyclin-like protein [Trametes versicolor FP-101664 SS1]EIW62296.1 cyclin-like protein [Trametes versicolor FP-101664 SS1]